MDTTKISGPAFSGILAIVCALTIHHNDHILNTTGKYLQSEHITAGITWWLIFVIVSGTAINAKLYDNIIEQIRYCLIPAFFMFVSWIIIVMLDSPEPKLIYITFEQLFKASVASVFLPLTIPLVSACREIIKNLADTDILKRSEALIMRIIQLIGTIVMVIYNFTTSTGGSR